MVGEGVWEISFVGLFDCWLTFGNGFEYFGGETD